MILGLIDQASKEYFKLDDLGNTGFAGYLKSKIEARIKELEENKEWGYSARIAELKELIK